jgi:hypothetical protein
LSHLLCPLSSSSGPSDYIRSPTRLPSQTLVSDFKKGKGEAGVLYIVPKTVPYPPSKMTLSPSSKRPVNYLFPLQCLQARWATCFPSPATVGPVHYLSLGQCPLGLVTCMLSTPQCLLVEVVNYLLSSLVPVESG